MTERRELASDLCKGDQIETSKSGRAIRLGNEFRADKNPGALNTPHDLSKNVRVAIGAALNEYLADAFPLYFKTKNCHCYMSGPHFRDSKSRRPKSLQPPIHWLSVDKRRSLHLRRS